LTARERAFIDFTEQFVSSVGTMEDDQVTRLQDFATADEDGRPGCAGPA
jgi:hypothetical protein